MAFATAARYAGSVLETVLALGLLGIGAVHATAGVPSAVLPAVGGIVLLYAAVVLAPDPRRRGRRNGIGFDDAVVFVGGLAIAGVCLGTFVALGRVF